MSFHDRLLLATAGPRADFLATPALCDAVRDGADRPLYLAYLAQAYHHVRWTCPLLRLAADRCGPADRRLAAALGHYVAEELGHECWILDDIRALGGDASPGHLPPPNWANRAMVGTVRDAIANTSPYAILGMVHVLEGISSLLAVAGAERTAARLGVTTGSARRGARPVLPDPGRRHPRTCRAGGDRRDGRGGVPAVGADVRARRRRRRGGRSWRLSDGAFW
jgi:hypothetical protein